MEPIKAVVGIDAEHRYRPALKLLRGLRFQLEGLILAHSVEMHMAGTPTDDGAEEMPDRDDQETLLGGASSESAGLAFRIETEMLEGPAADALIALADAKRADLIVVQSERKGSFRSFFFGSVSRGLAIASSRSLLISKGERASEEPLRVVFATDHSKYSSRSLDEFLRLGPEGIRSVHVVSAVAMGDYMFWATHFDPYRASEEREHRLRDEFERLNALVESRLSEAGYETSSEAPICTVNEAIGDAMADADLLVMGAQGHGFVERLLIGSNSLHQVIIEPHSVLLLRPTS